jgi:hypothetical protein
MLMERLGRDSLYEKYSGVMALLGVGVEIAHQVIEDEDARVQGKK